MTLGVIVLGADVEQGYLAVDVVPFATDQTENLLLTGTGAVLTTFYRYRQEIRSEQEMRIDPATLPRVAEALKKAVDARGLGRAANELGEDVLVFYGGAAAGAHGTASITSAWAPRELLALLHDLRRKGDLRKDVSRNRIRSIPFATVSGRAPKSVAEQDLSKEAWQAVRQSIEAPMQFVALDEGVYRVLISELVGQRQLVVLHGGQYFEVRFYEALPGQSAGA